MIRFSLILAILTISASLFSQTAQSVFLDKRVLEHYESELDAVKVLQKDIPEQEGVVLHKSMKQLRKKTEVLAQQGLSMYQTMSSYLNEETIKRLNDRFMGDEILTSELEYRNARIRKQNPKMREILMTDSDLDAFLDNIASIKKLSDELNYNATKKASQYDAESFKTLVASADNITSILAQTK